MALVKCKECGEGVSTKAKICPKCGAKPPKKTSLVTWTVLIMILLGVFGLMRQESNMSPEKKLERAERVEVEKLAQAEKESAKAKAQANLDAERKRKGFHCLSSLTGIHRGVKRVVKENLRDPNSFDHIETKITPVDENEKHSLIMTYRAKNAFGGKAIGNAIAIINNSNCAANIISYE